eukprot:scaffold139373_cov28-Tisochrysis_lutea.AAC.4
MAYACCCCCCFSIIISPRGDSSGRCWGVTKILGASAMDDAGESSHTFSSEGARLRSVGVSPTVRGRFLGSSR